jgi:hypothetical protein
MEEQRGGDAVKRFFALFAILILAAALGLSAADVYTTTGATRVEDVVTSLAAKADSATVTALASRVTANELNTGLVAAKTLAADSGLYGGWVDPFTSDSLATSTNAYYSASTDLYSTEVPGTSCVLVGGTTSDTNAFDENDATQTEYSVYVTYDLGAGNTKSATGADTLATGGFGGDGDVLLQGSNNGTDFTLIYEFEDTVDNIRSESGVLIGIPAYRYFRFLREGGGGPIAQWKECRVFAAATNDITLVSAAQAIDIVPGTAMWASLVKFTDTPTLGTDLKGYLSRDGSTWVEATLADYGLVDTYHLVYGTATLTGASNQTLYWKATTHNTKRLDFKAYIIPASQE